MKAVRYMKDSIWYRCKTQEIIDKIIEMRGEIKRQGWYKIDEVLTRKEREERYKLYELAKKWGAIEDEIRIQDNVLTIDNRMYKWEQKENRVMKLQ